MLRTVKVAFHGENHYELREAFAGCERSDGWTTFFLAVQNSPTYSLAVSTGWKNPLPLPSVALEGWVQIRVRHFNLTTVFQLHALLITLQITSTHLRKHL